MGGVGLFPCKPVVIGKSSQNITIKKQVILHSDQWMENGKLYCYIIRDDDITLDSVIFMRSYKEYQKIILTNNEQ